MSVEAISWALDQPIKHSTAKFVLVVLANCASGETMTAYPSTGYLVDATGQDRKTVLSNLRRLVDLGLIADTGERRGSTKQVIVYQLNTARGDAAKQAQIRNGSKNGTVPKTEGNSPVFPSKESRFSAKQSQKRDTEPLEPSGNRKSNQKKTREQVALPDWLPTDAWDDWVKYRTSQRKKSFTAKSQALSLRTLTDLHAKGFDARQVIERSIECGWAGLFEPPQDRKQSNRPSVTDRFSGSTYEGSADDEIPEMLRVTP